MARPPCIIGRIFGPAIELKGTIVQNVSFSVCCLCSLHVRVRPWNRKLTPVYYPFDLRGFMAVYKFDRVITTFGCIPDLRAVSAVPSSGNLVDLRRHCIMQSAMKDLHTEQAHNSSYKNSQFRRDAWSTSFTNVEFMSSLVLFKAQSSLMRHLQLLFSLRYLRSLLIFPFLVWLE